MFRKLFLLNIFLIFILFCNKQISISALIATNENNIIINVSNDIEIYRENKQWKIINDAYFLDIRGDEILYNQNNKLYLYNLLTDYKYLIHDKVYNALFMNDLVVFESDYNPDFICKNVMESLSYRNCFKIYTFDRLEQQIKLLNLIGMDNYLNDIENNLIVYNSIHSADSYCFSLCSYINFYDYENDINNNINKYEEVIFDMAGNYAETTQEARMENYRISRGGYYTNEGSVQPISYRATANAGGSTTYSAVTSRLQLYIKVD